jgi:two-component system nitrate/nitrite response regulator NarL
VLAGAGYALERSLLAAVRTDRRVELVGLAPKVTQAPGLVASLGPEIVLLHVSGRGREGEAAAQLIHDEWPDTRVLALADSESREDVRGVVEAGAAGYVLTNEAGGEVVGIVLQLLGA